MANTPTAPSPSPHSTVARWPLIQRPALAYAAALALTGLAFLLRWSLDSQLGNTAFLLFFTISATITAFLFGWGPGLVSTFAGVGLGVCFFILPRNSYLLQNPQTMVAIGGVTLQSIVICIGAGFLHRALRVRAHAEQENRALFEAEQRAHQAALEMNQTKDYFLAVLSHELRGPLSAIQFCVADRLSDPAVPFELREDFSMIERNAQMQSRLIADLLDLTRLTRGKLEVELHPLNLHLLLVEAVRTCSSPAEANHSPIPALHLHASQTWILGDRDRLLQVFWNILRNAAKFTGREGAIDVETFEPTPGRIAVRIRDTGIGLSAEAMERIFQPFEQAAQVDSKRKQGGLGLGLAIARGIMELHEGTLTGFSEGPGCGTAFTIELPTINPSTPPVSSRRSGLGRPAVSEAACPPAPVP